jgi:hypothetical protein
MKICAAYGCCFVATLSIFGCVRTALRGPYDIVGSIGWHSIRAVCTITIRNYPRPAITARMACAVAAWLGSITGTFQRNPEKLLPIPLMYGRQP